MFIKPKELVLMMAQKGLISLGLRGVVPGANLISILLDLRRRVKGKIDYRELARRMQLRESNGTAVAYMGYAVRE
jgi:hypothetical protein